MRADTQKLAARILSGRSTDLTYETIIGRPMGGKTIGKDGRPLGVHDYAKSLREKGYIVEAYTPLDRGELRQLKIEALNKQNKPLTEQNIAC